MTSLNFPLLMTAFVLFTSSSVLSGGFARNSRLYVWHLLSVLGAALAIVCFWWLMTLGEGAFPPELAYSAFASLIGASVLTMAVFAIRAFDRSFEALSARILEQEILERSLADRSAQLELEVAERQRTVDALGESEERFRQALENAPIGVALLDLDGHWIKVNQATCDLLGYNEKALLETSFQALTHPDDLAEDLANVAALLRGDMNSFQMEKRYRHRRGHFVWVMLSAAIVRDNAGKPLYFISQLLNITERREAREAMEATNNKLAFSVDELARRNLEMMQLKEMGDQLQACISIQEAAPIITHFGGILFPGIAGTIYLLDESRKSAQAVFGWGVDLSEIPFFDSEECWALRRGRPHFVPCNASNLACGHVKAQRDREHLCHSLAAQGQSLGVLHLFSEDPEKQESVFLDGDRDLVASFAEHISLVIANLKLREILHSQSVRDPLTSLFNRRYMEESIDRELRRASRNLRPLSILLFDVDHFKNFNDHHGHSAGDAALRALGDELRAFVRREDIACRYGGEEFLVILPDAELHDAARRGEQLRALVEKMAVGLTAEKPVGLSISVGVAAFPEHGQEMNDILEAADKALYAAKNAGRNRVVVAPVPQEIIESEIRGKSA